jgi:hypothetical protein
VVGAGWSGAYAAWRLAIDARAVDVSKTCVFEADVKFGGRSVVVRDVPFMEDLSVDAGGYRYRNPSDRLPKDLIEGPLGLPTEFYTPSSNAHRIIVDKYGNNAGFATGIEVMVERLDQAGAIVSIGEKLTDVFEGNGTETVLSFDSGRTVTAKQLILNMTSTAILDLDEGAPPARLSLMPPPPKEMFIVRICIYESTHVYNIKFIHTHMHICKYEYTFTRTCKYPPPPILSPITPSLLPHHKPESIIFTRASDEAAENFRRPTYSATTKFFAYYEDAWWVSKLGLVEGGFRSLPDLKLGPDGHPIPRAIYEDDLDLPVGDLDPINFSYKVEDGMMDGKLTASKSAWVGIGFSSAGSMTNTQFYVVGYALNGACVVETMVGRPGEYGRPQPDDQARVVSYSCDISVPNPVFSFTLDLSDLSVQNLIYAMGSGLAYSIHETFGVWGEIELGIEPIDDPPGDLALGDGRYQDSSVKCFDENGEAMGSTMPFATCQGGFRWPHLPQFHCPLRFCFHLFLSSPPQGLSWQTMLPLPNQFIAIL